MSLALTVKEQQLLAVFISHLPGNEMPKVDWEAIAPLVGHKYGRNARAAFNKVWDKLKAGNSGEDTEYTGSTEPKTPSKASAKKGVGARKTPIKADGSSPRKRRTKAQIVADRAAAAKVDVIEDTGIKHEIMEMVVKQEREEQVAEHQHATDHAKKADIAKVEDGHWTGTHASEKSSFAEAMEVMDAMNESDA